MYKLLHILLCIIYTSLRAYAIDSGGVINYTSKNGLPTNNVYSFIQDKYGYIWMATDNGVVKYNGYSFRIFNTNDGLPANDVWMLKEDNQGRIWLNSYASGLGYIKNDKYKRIDYDFHRQSVVGDFYEIGNTVLFWVKVGSDAMIYAISPDDKITSIPIEGEIFMNSRHQFISSKGYNLKRLLWRGDKIVQKAICTFESPKLVGAWRKAYRKGDKVFFFFKTTNLFYVYDLSSCNFNTVSLTQYGGDSDEVIYTINVEPQKISIYTDKAIYFIDDNADLLSKNNKSDIVPDHIQIAFQLNDNIGNSWFASNGAGAFLKANHVLPLKFTTTLDHPLNWQFVGKTAKGDIWWWEERAKKLALVSSGKNVSYHNIGGSHVWQVYDAGNGSVYICTDTDVLLYNPLTRKGQKIHDHKKIIGVGKNNIKVFSDKTGSLIDSLKQKHFANVMHMNIYKNKLFFSRSLLYALTNTDTAIFEDLITLDRLNNSVYDTHNNIFWYYNSSGIGILNPVTGKYSPLSKKVLNRLGISSIIDMTMDAYSNLYIVTPECIVIYNTGNRNFSKKYVNVNTVNMKLAVHGDYLLIAGSFGLAYANILGHKGIANFRIIPHVGEFYERVYNLVTDADGTIYVQTDNGIYDYNITTLLNTNSTISADNIQWLKMLIVAPYKHTIVNKDTVLLPNAGKSISFDCINYYGKGTPYFNYRISGFGGWKRSASEDIILPELKPEQYYKLICYVTDDNWRSNTYTLYLYKTPLWWQTKTWKRIFWIAGILLATGVVLLIVIVTRYYVNRANEKKTRLLDLELRAVHSQINPHFIFNSLSSALFFINRKDIDEAYKHVSKFSKLLRSYLKSSHERYVTLTDEISMLKNYIELQQTRFENKFDYAIEVENKIAADNIKIPSLLLQPIVENAINHGLFHKKDDKGKLTIRFLQGSSSGELICEIEDNGVGRQRAAEIKSANDAQRQSYGTRLTERLIDIFQEYEHMNIFLEYIDKQKPYTGTIARLTIKNLKYDV